MDQELQARKKGKLWMMTDGLETEELEAAPDSPRAHRSKAYLSLGRVDEFIRFSL